MSWRDAVLGQAPPGTPGGAPGSIGHTQLEGLLRTLCWAPGSVLLALDRLGNLAALDSCGTLQHISTVSARSHVSAGCAIAALCPAQGWVQSGPLSHFYTIC